MPGPPHRLCGPAAGSTCLGISLPRAHARRAALAQSGAVDTRIALGVYLLIAAAAAFVTASRTLSFPLLLLVLLALAVVAVLVRRQVIGVGGTTRVSVAFIVVYLVTFFVLALLFGR
jgi:membrane glycosyltransferase